MKLLLLATAFVVSVYGVGDIEWIRYKMAHKKVYTTREEDMRRLEQYAKSKKMVEEHNERYRRGETSYTMAINQFSDWFPEEIQPKRDFKLDVSTFVGKEFELPTGISVPDSINWVEKGAVTKVKRQLRISDCYAFSAAGALEAVLFQLNQKMTNLSAQELIDCAPGFPLLGAFQYVVGSGLRSDASYPYTGRNESCSPHGPPAVYVKGVYGLSDEEQMTVTVGFMAPVSLFFEADSSFLHYKSGIFDGTCAKDINYALLAVGYGKDEKTNTDYWLMKNSMGEDWGENGYARVRRNVNLCGLADMVIVPVPLYNSV